MVIPTPMKFHQTISTNYCQCLIGDEDAGLDGVAGLDAAVVSIVSGSGPTKSPQSDG